MQIPSSGDVSFARLKIVNNSWTAVPLEVLDEQHRRAAVGYAELGMYSEADTELNKIDPFFRAGPGPRR
jgi:hypothetical protein